jgi:AcrR family transcriptional regulator
VGLRESNRQRTRHGIASTAMRLFASRGFDEVTVGEVAREAGVSEKTVYNHFPTKEDLFFDEVPARLEALASAVHEREPGTSVFGALLELQLRGLERLTSERFAIFARILDDSAALQAKELEVMGRFADTLAEALRTELQIAELDAHVAANALSSVHWQFFRNARAHALAGRHGEAAARRLRTELRRSYELLEHGLGVLTDST